MTTRVVIPLVDPLTVPGALPRLHPLFEVAGETMLLATHLAGAISARELGSPVATLAAQDLTIGNALDFLLTGF